VWADAYDPESVHHSNLGELQDLRTGDPSRQITTGVCWERAIVN
jgi:hypothetical protein